jgi:predicted DNA-binding transcriptional regulator YafY
MPLTKNALNRIKYLDEFLSDTPHYYDTKSLTEKCNNCLMDDGYEPVTQRCIEKDIKFLEGAPFYASIKRERIDGLSIVRYENPGSSIFTKELTDDEKNLLSEVLTTIGQFDGLDNFTWLNNLGKKLGLDESRRKIISFGSNPYLKNSTMLGALFTAISNKQVIDVHYQSFESPQITEMKVHPYLLKQYNERWYLICALDSDNLIMNLALDRIVEFCPDLSTEYRQSEDDFDERFDDIIGVTLWEDDPIEEILVWVSDHEWNYINTKPIHGSQREVVGDEEIEIRSRYPEFGDYGRFLRLSCKINFELLQVLTSFFEGLVVLEPSNLRAEIKEKIAWMEKNYQ